MVTGTGHRLVLKLQPDPSRAARLIRAQPIIADAVSRGWPAADWVRVGSLADGTAYLLQEYVEGAPIGVLDAESLRAIFAANERQSGLALPTAPNDSDQLQAVVSGRHPWKSTVRDHSTAGAALVHCGDELIRRLGPTRLPVCDLVHGDYSGSNMIATRDGIRFIDCETVGRGTRVRDLADLCRSCFVYPGPAPTVVRLLEDRACAIAGPSVFVFCVVAVSYNNLAWWVENRSAAEFDEARARVRGLFDHLESTLV